MIDFTEFKNRYIIKGDIILERPLHIGKGSSLEPTATDLPLVKTPEGKPYIPGSSLKGVLRAELEKIVRTLGSNGIKLNGNKLRACNIFSDIEKCIPKNKLDTLKKKYTKNGKTDDVNLTKEIMEQSCSICNLFGSSEIASRVYIKDCYLKEDIETVKTEIKLGIAIDRDTGTTKKGALFDYETVPAGNQFSFEAILENVERWQLQIFGLILKYWEKGNLNVGGKKSIGLGYGILKNIKINAVEDDGLVEYLINDRTTQLDLNNLMDQLYSKLQSQESGNA